MTPASKTPPSTFLMPHARKIMDLAKEQGIEAEAYSGGWVLRLTKGPVVQYVYGYKFPLNTMASASTASDKAAASSIMQVHKISHIRTHLVINPNTSWASKDGIWNWVHQFAAKHNHDVVCKPKDGTGGVGVFHTTNRQELENALGKIFGAGEVMNATGRDAVICAYKPIAREIRVIMLNGVPEVIFEKFPPFVVGDGKRSTQALINEYLSKLNRAKAEIANSHIEPSLRMSMEVPAPGQKIRVHWKFNLGQGADAVLLGGSAVHEAKKESDVEDPALADVVKLAVKAADILNIKFGSVDIVAVEGEENPKKKFRVMEVNSGVMIDNMKEQHRELGTKIADILYKKVLQAMFAHA